MATRAMLSRPGFRDLVIGQAVSSFGDWMGTVALMALVLDLTGSATAVGVILVLRLLPAGFAGPIAAGVAERWDRRRIMLACDLVRAGLVALIPLVRAAWWVYLWAFMLEVANLVFLPARDASVPDLVDDEEELPAANGIILGSSYANIPIGAAAFALLTLVPTSWSGYLDLHSGALPLWLDGLTYLVSFAFIRRLAVLGPASTEGQGGDDDGRERHGAWAGVVAALRLPIVRAVLPATITAVIGVGALFSLGVVYVRQVLHAGTGEFGGMVALFGVGGLAGWAWLQRQHGASLRIIKYAAGAMGVILAIMSLLSTVTLAYVAAVPFGAAGAAALVSSITYLQETLTGEQRLLGLTVYHIIFRAGMSVAAIGGGLAAQALGTTHWPLLGTLEPSALVLLCAGVVMVAGATLMPTTVKDEARGERGRAVPRPLGGAGSEVVDRRDRRGAAR
jgi:MFS family permease